VIAVKLREALAILEASRGVPLAEAAERLEQVETLIEGALDEIHTIRVSTELRRFERAAENVMAALRAI
jgi:hypothetical protein